VPAYRPTTKRVAAHLRDVGLDYAQGHAGGSPSWSGSASPRRGLYAPKRQFVVTGRDITTQKAGTILYYPLVLLAIGGAASCGAAGSASAATARAVAMVCVVIVSTYGGVDCATWPTC
jgi:hypothetical protein